MTAQRLSTWLALRCREPDFQAFLHVDSEVEATRAVRSICHVTSRGDIDRDESAATRFHQFIRRPYFEFMTRKEHHV
ncbi:hypothetical protein [Collimonas arenae]|uniref:hypothetical protein n=1 Tax=Collimonas arenae TaxID=279058 RepID=UPI0012E0913B|nr:hypothetical protein [Collimonas arenae]